MTADGDGNAAAVNDMLPTKTLETLQGIVFGKSIRSHYAILHVAMKNDVDDERDGAPSCSHEYGVVRVEFVDNPTCSPTDMRSWCRRCCKLGDLVNFKGLWESQTADKESFLVEVVSLESADDLMSVAQVRHWSMPHCQEWQQRYRPKVVCDGDNEQRSKKRVRTDKDLKGDETLRHGGNKRDQGECVANFVIHIMMQSLKQKETNPCGGCLGSLNNSDWANFATSLSPELHDKATEALNMGSGVMDAAGGSGYVSMALGMKGVKSTVVDPRESVGKLPKRDRKVWNRLLRGAQSKNTGGETLLCQPVVSYDSLRAWFAKPPPEDVDTAFRHGDVDNIPVCGEEHELLQNCSAIVALHPDEATDAIVDMAVKQRIPFVAVPCCVFSRFFTYRRKPGTNLPVTTYEDLLDYLCSKDDSIQRTTLAFEGANVALWSVF